MQHSKIITIICLMLAIVPYVLFLCFSNIEDKLSLALAAPLVVTIVYVFLYFMFVLFRKNPFASAKVIDIYAVFLLVAMVIGYLSVLRYSIIDFPNGYIVGSSIAPVAFMSIIHTLKRIYKNGTR